MESDRNISKSTSFYSSFFRKDSFLRYRDNSFYAEQNYLKSQGFHNNLDISGNVVLELGAGSGRLTIALDRMGLLEKAKRYLVVEPSDGIENIKSVLGNKPNLVYIKCSFEDMHNYVEENSVDYFIAYGVIPHIDISLNKIASVAAKLIKSDGIIHVVSSYYGFKKEKSFRTRRRLNNCSSFHINTWALFYALLQIIAFKIPSKKLQKYYFKNFLFSPHQGILEKWKQFAEFYSVHPYNIHLGYKDYITSFHSNGFAIKEILPYSIGLKFQSKLNPFATSFQLSPQHDTILLGDDFFSDAVYEALSTIGIRIHSRYNLEEFMSKAPSNTNVILGSSPYTTPYYKLIDTLENMQAGYFFPKNLFIFQMFL